MDLAGYIQGCLAFFFFTRTVKGELTRAELQCLEKFFNLGHQESGRNTPLQMEYRHLGKSQHSFTMATYGPQPWDCKRYEAHVDGVIVEVTNASRVN